MDDRATKFKKFLEDLPRLCSPTICGTLSQPTTRAERHSNKSQDKFEWSLEQKAILSPANITTATCSDIGDMDHSFLHQESEQFFSQKTIAPSPMTTPSTRYSRSQPAPNRQFNNYMFDERDEDTDSDEDDEDDDEDDDENLEGDHDDESDLEDINPATQRVRRAANMSSNSDTDIDMEVLHDDDDDDDDDEDEDEDTDDETDQTTDDTGSEMDDTDQDDEMTDEYEDDDDDHREMGPQRQRSQQLKQQRKQQEDLDNLFLSPPLRSSQTQQRVDIFSPETFGRVMEDENTLQSTPKTIGSQISRTRTRRGSGEMYD